LRLELVEHLARIALLAAPLGGPRRLPEDDIAALSAKGRPASVPDWSPLGQEAAAPKTSGWSPPPPSRSEGRPDVRALVAETLRRVR
jgi:hypothetical protein